MCMHKRKTAVRYMLVSAIFPILFIIGLVITTYSSIGEIREHTMYDHQMIEDRKWDMIENTLEENVQKARINANAVKQKISSDLLAEYSGHMFDLHKDLVTKSDSPAFKIFDNDIKDVYLNNNSENNRVFVANKTGILADRGYVSSSKESRDWDAEIKSKLNSELASKAVSMILTKNKEMIYWKPDTAIDDTSYNIPDPSIRELRNVYQAYGIEELKNYDILVPVYITNDGDILGVPDVDLHGKQIVNDKIIVIQEFSIYDAIMQHRDDIERYNAYAKDCDVNMESAIANKMMAFGLLVVLAFCALLAILYGSNTIIKWGGGDASSDGSNNS